jgi:hypothetical protein
MWWWDCRRSCCCDMLPRRLLPSCKLIVRGVFDRSNTFFICLCYYLMLLCDVIFVKWKGSKERVVWTLGFACVNRVVRGNSVLRDTPRFCQTFLLWKDQRSRYRVDLPVKRYLELILKRNWRQERHYHVRTFEFATEIIVIIFLLLLLIMI